MRNPDGSVSCHRCGVDLGAGSLAEAAVLTVLGASGYGEDVLWCTDKCLPEILTGDTVAHRPVALAVAHPDGTAYTIEPKKPAKKADAAKS